MLSARNEVIKDILLVMHTASISPCDAILPSTPLGTGTKSEEQSLFSGLGNVLPTSFPSDWSLCFACWASPQICHRIDAPICQHPAEPGRTEAWLQTNVEACEAMCQSLTDSKHTHSQDIPIAFSAITSDSSEQSIFVIEMTPRKLASKSHLHSHIEVWG